MCIRDRMYVAVLGIYLKLHTFLYMPASGIIQAMRPIAGYNYGAGEKKRMKRIISCSMAMTGAIMVAGTVLSLFFPNQIFSIFQKDAQLIALGSQALRIISLGFLVSSVSLVYSGLFEALGMGCLLYTSRCV